MRGPTHEYIGAPAGCWKIYGKILAKEYGDPLYFGVHQYTVDAYAVQHPGKPSRKSIQSVAVHLISLYLMLERGYNSNQVIQARKSAAKSSHKFTWLEPPANEYPITVIDVIEANDVREHSELVKSWAECTWNEWKKYHNTIKDWADI
jgi:hypothetical protein